MDDGSQQPHTYGSGQQRTQHPRPFFYVQPPSQPYYLYQQWQMNNPYNHYGLPGGFNFSRPCMYPYQYMQYPGFVFPPAPIYPADYRRMFEPRFHAPAWNQQQQQQQQQQQHHPQHHLQHQGRREMACSEAQTDPSDAITKLIECLDKIRTSDLRQGPDRELDSGVASQSSGMFSPGEEKKGEEQGHVLPSVPDDLQCPAVTLSDSTTAVYDGESSRRSLDTLSPYGCWSGALEEELPLDSSSVHEEHHGLQQIAHAEHFDEVAHVQSDIVVTGASARKCDAEELLKSSLASSVITEAKSSNSASKVEHQTSSLDAAKPDPSFQILKLPFESVLRPEAAGGGHFSSPAAPYLYNYISTQTTHERMSVLSPSLDELSSRDEMISTDLDDVDLFPKTVYTGHRLSEVIGAPPAPAEDIEDVWLPGSKRILCVCCGKNMVKGTGRSRVHNSTMYRDEAADSDEESRYGRGCEQPVRVVVRKHTAARKPHSAPPRHTGKPWYKRGQHKDPSDPFHQEGGLDRCKQESADGGGIAEVLLSELQCRTCQDGHCSEDVTPADQTRWKEGDVIPRRRQTAPPQRQEISSQRKVMYHRPRDEDNDDDEPPPLHWERGSTMRESRC